ncbi:MAG: FkbM family methyltransferase [Alphaproteobacteria bacterium]|nr:MAG: FkbM family methyltransferase [Alphaproteobacteria bacterium]
MGKLKITLHKFRRKIAHRLHIISEFLYDPRSYKQKRENLSGNIDIELLRELTQLGKTIKPETIIDIGANIGTFVKTAQKVFPEAKKYCFEPNSDITGSITTPQTKLYHVALGNVNEKIRFNISSHHPSSSFLKPILTSDKHPDMLQVASVEIEVKRLDDVLDEKEINKPLLIKIDVEGYELEVIKGGGRIISLAEVVIIETSYQSILSGQPTFKDIHETMLGLGFKYFGNIGKLFPYNGLFLQENSVFRKIN